MNFPLVENIISSVAPHVCLLCDLEGQVVCSECLPRMIRPRRSSCFICNSLTDDFKTCQSCRKKTALKRVWVATRYEAYVKDLIWKFKFERLRAAHNPLAQMMMETIIAGQYDFVVPVPSATSRFRKRGYNPAELLARQISKRLAVSEVQALGRHGQARQVGHSRKERLKQLDESIYFVNDKVSDSSVLLVDDVLTTGATLHQCAEVLKQAGAKRIEAVVIAGN